MRLLYSILLTVALPVLFLRLWIKGRRVPGYRQHWRERLGYCGSTGGNVIWLHAVSVGEAQAAGLLIDALRQRYPDKRLVVTTTTPTGRQLLEQRYADRIEKICYLPFDLPGSVKRFLDANRPEMAIILEVELWPNLFTAIGARNLPLMLVSARLSYRSYRGYGKLSRLVRSTLMNVTCVAAQTVEDRSRFVSLGVPVDRISVIGNLKFDATLPRNFSACIESFRDQLGTERQVWVAGSTHDGEERVVLAAHQRLRIANPGLLLLLVPRHPERADAVAALVDRLNLSCTRYSEAGYAVAGADVLLVDRLGQQIYCYGLAAAAFVGGSLVDKGGHNPIEPLLAGTPLISGSSVENFRLIYDQLETAGAALFVDDADALAEAVQHLLLDPDERRCRLLAGRQLIASSSGGVARVMSLIGVALES